MTTLRVLGQDFPASPAPPAPAASGGVRFGAGFHGAEHAEGLPFRWMSLTGRLEFDPEGFDRYLDLELRSNFHDLSQRVVLDAPGRAPETHELVHGWNQLSVPIPAGATSLALGCNKIFPREYYPGDGRELAVQLHSPTLHAEPARHDHMARQHANRVRNLRELLDGKVVLESTPPKLGIDLTGACNVKPPCVYCNWDFTKALEGANVDLPFGLDTLDEYGAFFENSNELVNCSIGEPFMMRNVDALLDAFGSRGKMLELTTNGQILTDTNIAKLLGRNVHLYISLDAATPETYRKLRNDTFPKLLDNMRRLVKAKGGRGALPLVYLVFMPMRANVHEVDAFVKLVAELGADRLVLRPLNDSEGVALQWDRAGYHYDYQQELLPFEQLVHVSGRVAELCRLHDVELSDQLDFGGSLAEQFRPAFEAGRREAAAAFESERLPPTTADRLSAAPEPSLAARTPPQALAAARPAAAKPPSLGAERLPACTEPWSSLYILRRGTVPCCYGGRSIASMADFSQAWNGPLNQAIRSELLHGRFHDYCFASPDCPIVKKAEQARVLSPLQSVQLWGRRVHDRWARARYGWPGTVYRTLKHHWLNALRQVRRTLSR